ncbi:hypothetical protein MMYC01_209688 [Madurella mycetomatis]|uniref:Uncharacterized protein n=1 Tax=Madurella mycetomatis TaxID=100816 RepID=A0A175VRT5_9PEZI|nr:hypothetical protein MMYC01_209688 [Madurella mycetomatis]
MRDEPGDFNYNIGDARLYASRTPAGTGLQYTHDLPTLGSSDVLGSYRGGSTYPYTPATKAYYPAMPAYGAPYADEFEFSIAVSQPVLGHEPVGMLPGQWNSGARAKPPSFSGMYMDTDGSYSAYSSPSLVPRASHTTGSDSSNFSFSGVAASLPLPSAPASDRLLPNPTARSSTLPYPASAKAPPTPPTSTTSTLVDVAATVAYTSGFDTPGLPYSSQSTTSSLASQHSSSRANSGGYTVAETVFGEQERGIQSQGPAFDMTTYTAEPRRGSGGSSGGSVLTNDQPYTPGESAHNPPQRGAAAAYLGELAVGSHAHRYSHAHSSHTGASGSGTTGLGVHAEDRHVAVASRH